MIVVTKSLKQQVPHLVTCAFTQIGDPGVTHFSGTDFIRWQLSPIALRTLFQHAPPYSDEEIRAKAITWEEKVGLKDRMIFSGTTEELGILAALKAVKQAGLSAEEICQIREVRFATNTGRGYPNGADAVVGAILAEYGIDPHDWEPRAERIQEACSVGIQGLQDADQAIRSGAIQGGYYLLVVAEKTSELASRDDWDRVNLFGDGAVAFLLKASDTAGDDTVVAYEGVSSPANGQIDFITQTDHGFTQEGEKVHTFVLKKVPERIRDFLKHTEVDPKTIAHLILHQPSGRTLKPLEKRIFSFNPELKAIFHYCFDQTTNMSSATCLWEFARAVAAGEIKRGELVLLVAFGAGMSMSIILLRA